MSEVCGDAMEDCVRHFTGAAGCGGCGNPLTKIDSPEHGEALVLDGAVSVLKHSRSGVRMSGPLALHLSELIMCARGRELSGVTQRRYRGAACDVEVVGITIKLDGGSKGTIMMHARVQGMDLCENI
jgi:hypothetical protein